MTEKYIIRTVRITNIVSLITQGNQNVKLTLNKRPTEIKPKEKMVRRIMGSKDID
jgi:hypothetical protein